MVKRRVPSLQFAIRFEKKKDPIKSPSLLQISAMVNSRAVFPWPAGPRSHRMDDDLVTFFSQSRISWMMASRVPSMHLGGSRRALESRRAAGDVCRWRRSFPTSFIRKDNKNRGHDVPFNGAAWYMFWSPAKCWGPVIVVEPPAWL